MTTQQTAYPQLLQSLDDLRRQWRGRQVFASVLGAGAAVVLTLTLVVGLDALLRPETAGRILLALVLLTASAVALGLWVVRRWLEDHRDDFFAALVEERFPELNNRLINGLQLGRGTVNGYSPQLVEAVVSDASAATADLELAECLDGRPLKWAAGALGLAALALAVSALLGGPRFGTSLARVLQPWADIPPYTATQVADPTPGNARVPEGTTVTVEARIHGERPAEVTLWRLQGSKWHNAAMSADRSADDLFRAVVPQAGESFDYYVAAGDGRSKRFRVEVVKRPQVRQVGLTRTPPAYTAQPPRTVPTSDGEISGLPGTVVAITLQATKPLQEAKLVTETGEVVALTRGGDDQTWAGRFDLWAKEAEHPPADGSRLLVAPARYQIKLLDTDGVENADPLWRSINAVKDQPPSVVITLPGRPLYVKPDARIPLTVEARDDYGLGAVRLWYRVNDDPTPHALAQFPHDGPPQTETTDQHAWDLKALNLKGGTVLRYWATAVDRNAVTGPGEAKSAEFTVTVETPEQAAAKLDFRVADYVKALEDLVRLQRENRAQTASGVALTTLGARQQQIRQGVFVLARAMEKDALPVATVVQALDALHAGPLAEAVQLLEAAAADAARAAELRGQSLPVQDKIIAALEALLARLQRNEQAKEALRKLAKTDPAAHKNATKILQEMIKGVDNLLKDQTETAGKFERLPKKPGDELKEEAINAFKELDELAKKAEKWQKGNVNELTKLPQGFVDDFGLRPDVNKIFEEIEKAAQRAPAQKLEVALEDLGAGLATKMKEDLEMWMPDSPDNAKWVLEEPLDKKPMKIPEMPLPKATQDLIGDLLQKAEEFDEEADDVTSAWGDNLDQAGWGVSDGPISSFSAKGKTGNDQPNSHEVSGRSGDGRRGKSSGQMVGDTARALEGRKTPARVNNEKYEPGQLKQEGAQDPNGATGGGKVAGAGRKGLQGGTPPPEDLKRDLGRLSAKQAGVRENAEQVAQKLKEMGVTSPRLKEGIELMKAAEQDLRDLRYDDAARKRKEAMARLQGALRDVDQTTGAAVSRARDLPPELRQELRQAADEGYPAGYEGLLKSYYKALSNGEK